MSNPEGKPIPKIDELRLRNVPLAVALKYIGDKTGMRYKVDDLTVTLFHLPKKGIVSPDGSSATLDPENRAKAYIEKKLRTIVIPRIDFKETTIEEALDFLRQRAFEFDTQELDKAKKGINFVVSPPEDLAKPMPMIDELRLQNVTLETILKHICTKTGMRYEVTAFAVIFHSPPTAEAPIVDDVSSKELIHVGGQVRRNGSIAWKKGITLYQAIQEAGGATEFGSMKRVHLYRNGKELIYDLTDPKAMKTPVKVGDTIVVAQKNIFGE